VRWRSRFTPNPCLASQCQLSSILDTPNAVVFLVHGTGFIAMGACKSSPQMKQKLWFERFTELGQNKNVPMGQNLEG
jgi:hypothetical protein